MRTRDRSPASSVGGTLKSLPDRTHTLAARHQGGRLSQYFKFRCDSPFQPLTSPSLLHRTNHELRSPKGARNSTTNNTSVNLSKILTTTPPVHLHFVLQTQVAHCGVYRFPAVCDLDSRLKESKPSHLSTRGTPPVIQRRILKAKP